MSNKPNNPAHRPAADEVFDASSMLEEVKAGSRKFKLGGEVFDLPAPTAWPDEAFIAANREDPLTAATLILGEEDYKRFKAAGGNALFLQTMVEKLHGASVGESSGSSSS
jgi:hypothetical protein